jgi:3-phosphoshikimate 1-carboxyvinyltransferase
MRSPKPSSCQIEAPPSKSYSNRALFLSALAPGRSVLVNPLECDDTDVMARALTAFGAAIETDRQTLRVTGVGGRPRLPERELVVGQAGTAMRFLCGMAALAQGETTLNGGVRMRERPIGDLLNGLTQMKVTVRSAGGFPPVSIRGGSLRGGAIRLRGEQSSQYCSTLLMIAPFADAPVEITIEGALTSKSYIDMTIAAMGSFGVQVENRGYKTFRIGSGQTYQPCTYGIEGDASGAAYFFAAAAVSKKTVRVTNLNPESLQGDIRFVDLLARMGCEVKKGENDIEVSGADLRGIEIDMNDMPDTVPPLAVVALFARSATVIKNIANLRLKESDRLQTIACALQNLGARVSVTDSALTIIPAPRYRGAFLDTREDHRLVMSFAVAGLRIPGLRMSHPDCVSKSYPGFWREFARIAT